MVAKSYQNLQIAGEPYSVNGRMYVKVIMNNGSLKQVRYYTEKEYQRMYPEIKQENKIFKTQKEVLGFEKGYITIFKGNTYEDKEYFKMNAARYTRWWGWYFVSTIELPNDIPEDVFPIRLNWELVGNEDGTLKTEQEVKKAVESLIYEEDISEYQGQIGDKLELIVRVEKAILIQGNYGITTLYTLRDYNGNCYIWNTASKSWQENTEHHIIGSVKGFNQYKGIKETILIRCREI